ncbi:ABC transporter substrate-binding protein [Youxingia wuxianensis]|nr:ABC transporter substrate-binding protein [Youxingia wuxianensis]
MKKILALVLATLMIATVFTACGDTAAPDAAGDAPASETGDAPAEDEAPADSEQPAAEGDTIKIGVLAPLTGEVSVYGIATSNGIKMGVDEINEKGGILGKQIELITMDEKGDPTEAVNAYNSLVDQGIVALIGDVTSKPCLAVAEVALEDNMPMLTATGTAEDITKVGPNVFRTCFMDPFQGKIMATFAADNLKAKKVAVMFDNGSDYSKGLADSFKAQAEEKGMEVTAFEGYATADIDFTTLLNKIIATSPDAIFVPDYYGDVSLVLDQARTAGYTGAMLGGDGWDGVLTTLPEDKLSAANNGYFSNHYSAADTVAADFLSKYQELFGLEGNAFAALGYDSAYIMAQAIEAAGSTDSQAIIDALAAVEFDGVTGHITFDENGDPIKSVAVTKFVDGKAELDSKITA